MAKKRVMSGMRPTGALHLGHYLGVLRNWVRLQDEYDCYFAIVDWHALTTGFQDTSRVKQNIDEVLLDWLAAGVDPEKATIYVQSAVPEIAELSLLLGMITPMNWLTRNPTVKEQISDLHLDEERVGYGLMGYPVLQSADILMFLGDLVPVGKDQLPHLELSRDIARRFNHLYGEVFPEPQALLAESPLIIGTDGRKMSKSYGNVINMGASTEEIRERVMGMITDPARQRRNDPGHPEVCTLFANWQMLGVPVIEEVARTCRLGTLGCVDDKKQLAAYLDEVLGPMRERRRQYSEQPDLLARVLARGNERARRVARETIHRVRAAMQLPDFDAVTAPA
jgi:tryptophanyl-tRNA synthetase